MCGFAQILGYLEIDSYPWRSLVATPPLQLEQDKIPTNVEFYH